MSLEIDHIWAKSGARPGEPGESLVAHTRNVLARLGALYERQPALGQAPGCVRLWSRVAMACALHDLGKCAPGFQQMLRGGPRFEHRHEVISLGLLPWLLQADPYADLPWVAAGIVSHHRELKDLRQRYSAADPTMDLSDGCEVLVGVLDRSALEAMWTIATEHLVPAAQEALSRFGVERVEVNAAPPDFSSWAQWLAPSVRRCLDAVERMAGDAFGVAPHAIMCRFTRGLVLLSDHSASAGEYFADLAALASPKAALAALGLSERAYDHQVAAAGAGRTTLLVAPTGSGKTEAALLWAAGRRASRAGAPPLFYVLPYQASLNAMRRRLQEVAGEDLVVLQHSRAAQALYRQLLGREYSPANAQRLAVRERALGRLHVAPVRVLSPYQLLRGAYQLPGHPALWTDAAGGLFVLDEIHAYETTRLGMILEVLRHLVTDLGADVLVASATLPSVLHAELTAAVGTMDEIRASPDTFARFRRHRLRLRDTDLTSQGSIEEIAEAAGRGLAVLVVATTVARAQDIAKKLRERSGNGSVRLLHGRFCGRDRFAKEEELSTIVATGIDYARRERVVLVATQVVEVSLDVDFDVLFSDPAPLEALVQRFGRVNRRRRRPCADVVVATTIPAGSPVYPRTLVERATRELQRLDDALIDEAEIQSLLDAVYVGEIGRRWAGEVQQARQDFRRDVLDALAVFDSSPELARKFDEMFDGSEVLPVALESEYDDLSERDLLLAPSLLVPITSRQMAWLRRRSLLRERVDGIAVANVRYDTDTGLDLAHAVDDGQ